MFDKMVMNDTGPTVNAYFGPSWIWKGAHNYHPRLPSAFANIFKKNKKHEDIQW